MAQKINQKQFVNIVKEAITRALKESGFNGYDMQPQTPMTKQQQIDASWKEFNDNNKNRLAQQQQDATIGSYLDSNINADDLKGQLGMDAMSNDKDVADIAQMTKGTPRQTGQRYDNYLKQKYMESKKQKINMTESQLNNLIKECITEVMGESKESVNKVLKEGMFDYKDTEIKNMWVEMLDTIGPDSMLDALFEYLDPDTLENFLFSQKKLGKY